MLVEIQRRKCLRCGEEFTFLLGGFILRRPVCPHCASIFTRKIGKKGVLMANLSDKIITFTKSNRQ